MKWAVVTFPGSLDDRDTTRVLRDLLGQDVVSLWHKDDCLPSVDCVVLPGGFSYGDYLRCGAIARFAPIMGAITAFANTGGLVIGICNGFQVLCEAGLLPGALVRNRGVSYVCREVALRVETTANPFMQRAVLGDVWRMPVKHGEGCYVADPTTLARLERDGRILLRYCRPDGSRARSGEESVDYNPNGSLNDIAGVMNASHNVFGLMPHPEHAADRILLAPESGDVETLDGLRIFRSITQWVAEGAAQRAAESLR